MRNRRTNCSRSSKSRRSTRSSCSSPASTNNCFPTITSRTQLVKVNRLRDDELTTALVERHGLGRDDAKKVAHRSDGSYRQAQLILSEETPESDPAAQFLAWMRACLQLNVGALSKQMDEFASESRERQKSYLQFCLQIVRECVLLQYGDERLVRLEGKDMEAYRKFAPFVHTGNMDVFSKRSTTPSSTSSATPTRRSCSWTFRFPSTGCCS